MNKRFYKSLIIILSSLFILVLGLNVSLALMSARKDTTGIVQFKEHRLDISIVNDESIVLKPEELTIGANSTRIITIKNPQTSTSCVLRIWLEFYIEGEIDTNYLSFNLGEENFAKSSSDKFYYKKILNSNESLENLVLNFSVNNNLSTEYEGKKYNLKLFIESIQSTKGAVDEWSNDYPSEWRINIENNLSN